MKPRMTTPVAAVSQSAQASSAPPQKTVSLTVEEPKAALAFVSTPTNVVVMPALPTPPSPSVRAEEGFAALLGVAGKKLNWARTTPFLPLT